MTPKYMVACQNCGMAAGIATSIDEAYDEVQKCGTCCGMKLSVFKKIKYEAAERARSSWV